MNMKVFTFIYQGVNDGSITKHLMSEDVEEGHSEGNILIITGKNFEGIAYNEDTHGELHKNKFGIIFKNFIIIFNISKMRISGPSDSSSTLIFNDLFVKAFIGQTRS